MTDAALNAQIVAAHAYEGLHVPALFQAWAGPVLDAAGVAAGDRLLDVACGTGVLARTALPRVGPGGSVTGLDPLRGMLAVAEEIESGVIWEQGTAESLPFPDESFDAVVSQFGLMFFTDREAAIREMVRVLVPGGKLGVAVWDVLAKSPAYAPEVAILDRVAGQAAGDALRAPFVLGDTADLEALFSGPDLESVAIVTRAFPARFPSLRTLIEADLRGWLPVMGVHLSEELIQQILAEAETDLADLVQENGQALFDESGHIVVARKRA
jgi:SAM-dependent methyltransferase